jgi:hypothetical protein
VYGDGAMCECVGEVGMVICAPGGGGARCREYQQGMTANRDSQSSVARPDGAPLQCQVVMLCCYVMYMPLGVGGSKGEG